MIRIEDRLRRTERNLCNEAADEIERLRGLLRECQPYLAGWSHARELWDQVKKEVGDE